MKHLHIQAARRRVLAFGLQDQMSDAEHRLSSEVYSVLSRLTSNALEVEQIRVLQSSPHNIVRLTLREGDLGEDALEDIGRAIQLGRKSVPGFWVALKTSENAIELGGES